MTVRVLSLTTARSDYGPQRELIEQLAHDPRFQLLLCVGGSHLSEAHGATVREIERDGHAIAGRLPFLLTEAEDPHLALSAGRALKEASRLFDALQPDVVLLYGDRFELLPLATAALLARLPIAHMGGGEITEGAIDNSVRDAVTKLAHVHLAATEGAAARIRSLREENWRVHVVGEPAVDTFLHGAVASDEELVAALGFAPDDTTLLVTYHPVTAIPGATERELAALVAALAQSTGTMVITAPAPDPGGGEIRRALMTFAHQRERTVFVDSLGSHLYRGLLRHVGVMVGNSSSGLLEGSVVPVPVVNVGVRQAGRERGANVIDVSASRTEILAAIERARSPTFRASLVGMRSPYGDGQAARRVLDVLSALPPRDILLRKRVLRV